MNHYFTNNDVKSNLHLLNIKILEKDFSFYSDNGVFSKQGLDFGSRLLIKTLYSENIYGNVLDVGCGYGIIGILLNKLKNVNCDMIDINKRAIHLAEMNIKLNNCHKVTANCSDIYEKVNNKYDFIVTNPPIRAGKKVVYDILFNAQKHLKKEGKLYFVMRKEQGAKTAIRDLNEYASVDVIIKSKNFYIICCIFR